MQTGDKLTFELGTATLDVSAGGQSRIAPEYRVAVRWTVTR
jgi:hypothetical protein